MREHTKFRIFDYHGQKQTDCCLACAWVTVDYGGHSHRAVGVGSTQANTQAKKQRCKEAKTRMMKVGSKCVHKHASKQASRK